MQELIIGYRMRMMIYSGQRSKLANEFFTGIRIIKYYAWERFVHKSFEDIRVNELSIIKDSASLRGIIEALTSLLPTAISIAIFGFAVLIGTELSVSTVFTVMALLNLLNVNKLINIIS
jgi:ABC-type multidrug transport system fused ATPase/permease subunit